MPGEFSFYANTPGSYDAMELRKQIALKLMGQKRAYPKTLGEGLASIGQDLGDIGMMRMLASTQGAQDAARSGVLSGAPPAPGAEVPAAPPAASPRTAYAPPDDTVDEPPVADKPPEAPAPLEPGVSPPDVNVDPNLGAVEMAKGRREASSPLSPVMTPPPLITTPPGSQPRSMFFNRQQMNPPGMAVAPAGGNAAGFKEPNLSEVPPIAPPGPQSSAGGGYNYLDARADTLGPRSTSVPAYSPKTELAIAEAARANGIDPKTFRAIAGIESSGDPGSNRNKGTQYKGLFQLGTKGPGSEWARHGQGDVYDPQNNATAAAKLMVANRDAFRARTGRDPTPAELYLVHQQGPGFYSNGTMTNIAGNLPPSARTPANMTHQGFENWWTNRLSREMGAPSNVPVQAAAPPAAPPSSTTTDITVRPAPPEQRSEADTGDAQPMAFTGLPPEQPAGDARDAIAQALMRGQAAQAAPRPNPPPQPPITAATPVGPPPEAANNPPIPFQVAQNAPPGQMPPLQSRVPPATVPRDVSVPQTSAPLPQQAQGVYDKPIPPARPPMVPKGPEQTQLEALAANERDPYLKQSLMDRAKLWEERRATEDARVMREYDSALTRHNQSMAEWYAAQRNLPQTQEALKQARQATQQGEQKQGVEASFGVLPPQAHSFLGDSKKNAQSAVESLQGIRNAREVIDAGTIFGLGAPAKLAYYKARALAGDQDAARIVAATETYRTALGPTAAQAIKTYGGPQVSNEDRREGFAMTGADFNLNEQTARRMLDIGERSAIAAINKHREDLGQMLKGQQGESNLRTMYDVREPMAGLPMEKGASTTFSTMDEANAAVAAGRIQKGDKFTVGGKKYRAQ